MNDARPVQTIAVFVRLQGRAGHEEALATAIRTVVAASRLEAGCLSIEGFRAADGLFFIHSRWVDEAAFELHAALPHTVHFLASVEPLVDPPPEVTRTLPLS